MLNIDEITHRYIHFSTLTVPYSALRYDRNTNRRVNRVWVGHLCARVYVHTPIRMQGSGRINDNLNLTVRVTGVKWKKSDRRRTRSGARRRHRRRSLRDKQLRSIEKLVLFSVFLADGGEKKIERETGVAARVIVPPGILLHRCTTSPAACTLITHAFITDPGHVCYWPLVVTWTRIPYSVYPISRLIECAHSAGVEENEKSTHDRLPV